MRTIFFHNLYTSDGISTLIAIANAEYVDLHLKLKKIYYTLSIPKEQEYPWDIGTKMINWKENTRYIGSYVFEEGNIDKLMARGAIITIFEGVKN